MDAFVHVSPCWIQILVAVFEQNWKDWSTGDKGTSSEFQYAMSIATSAFWRKTNNWKSLIFDSLRDQRTDAIFPSLDLSLTSILLTLYYLTMIWKINILKTFHARSKNRKILVAFFR